MILEIYLSTQKAYLRNGSAVLGDYSISSSKFGIGTELDSFKTPTGRFTVYEKIGDGEPIFTQFQHRKPMGLWNQVSSTDDLILTRIVWLQGCEQNNANTKDRHIYLHGTNQEHLIGTPASLGCIRFKNTDILNLFSLLTVQSEIVIYP